MFLDLLNHWITEIFITGTEEHQNERTRINMELMGDLGVWGNEERSVRGVRRPAWFQETTMDDIDEMVRVLGSRL